MNKLVKHDLKTDKMSQFRETITSTKKN